MTLRISFTRVAESLAVAMIASALSIAPARAQTFIDFDDLNPRQIGVGSYRGFTFSNFQAIADGRGVVSPNQSAYNPFGREAAISSGARFTFNYGYITSSGADVRNVTAVGFRDGFQVASRTFTIETTPTLTILDFQNINRIEFQGYSDRGGNPVLFFDNLLLNGPLGGPLPIPGVPEPGTWGLFILGFGLIGGALRRRRHAGVLAVASARQSGR